MRASRIQQIEELFHAAADLTAGQRQALLDERCGSDAALRAEVEQLLHVHDVQRELGPDDDGFVIDVAEMLNADKPESPALPQLPPGKTNEAAMRAGNAAAHDDFDLEIQADDSGTPPELQPGDHFGKYLVEKRLGEGGQAVVYQAFDRLGAAGHVALKVPLVVVPVEYVEAWTRDEIEPLVKLDHPNIVRVVDGGCVEGVPYVATELVDALPLGAHVKTQPPTLRQVLDWMIQLCDALQAVHQRGIIHRDLKPDNILIDRRGQPRIIDFAISALRTPYATPADIGPCGTPEYLAPEQARADEKADHRVDVFTLGGVLKFLLDSTPPYGGNNFQETFLAACAGDVRAVDETAGPPMRRAMARVANRALRPDAVERFRTAAEMGRALRRLRNRRRTLALAAAAVAGILLLGVALVVWPSKPSIDPGVDKRATGGAEAPTTEGNVGAVFFDVHFQRHDQRGSYQRLTADLLPLYSGDRVQIHAQLPQPMYVAIAAVTSSDTVTIIYPEEGDVWPGPVRSVQIPPGQDEWLPLEPPEGTETLILLASRQLPPDRAAVERQLAALGAPPMIDERALLVADERGARLLLSGGTSRALGKHVVQSEKGFIDKLLEYAAEKWDHVQVLSFPHALPMP